VSTVTRNPERVDRADLVRLMSMAGMMPGLSDRLGLISGALLGRPYISFPLVGAPDEPERLVSRLDRFDCVTFVESVLAVGLASAPDRFEALLRALRYHHGEVSWAARNHYMSQWIERNTAAGRLVPVLPERWIETGEERPLTRLDGHPPVPWRVHMLPRERCAELDGTAHTGDVVAFVSTMPDLDTFHVGLLVHGTPVGLRHASRSGAQVTSEPLQEFIQRNELPGVLVARPRGAGDMP